MKFPLFLQNFDLLVHLFLRVFKRTVGREKNHRHIKPISDIKLHR